MGVSGIVLTGGRSSRMGRPKALLRLGPVTFLERVVGALEAAGLVEVVVVTGEHDTAIRAQHEAGLQTVGVTLVTNPTPDGGQLSSFLVGLDALHERPVDAVVMALVDHPMVAADTVTALVAAFHRSRPLVARPIYRGRHGHPVLFSSETFAALRAAPRELGAKAVVRAAGARLCDVVVEDDGVVTDVDTPEDYARVVARVEGRGGDST